MSPTKLVSLASLLAMLGATSAFPQSSVIYREVFSRVANSDQTASTVGWSLYLGATATNISSSNPAGLVIGGTVDTPLDTISTANSGQPGYIGPVNAGTTGGFEGGLFGFRMGTNSFLAFTSEYTLDRSLFSIDTLSVASFARNSNNAGPISFAVQIGGSWYVSDTVLDTSVQTVASPATLSLNFGSSSWSALNVTAGSTLSVGASATLPTTGNITAFGFYGRAGDTYADGRWDNFVVTASPVPEPSSFAALAGIAALGFVATRRRRK